MNINDNEAVSLRLNVHKMIAAVTSNRMCHKSLFRSKVPMNGDSRSSRIFIVRKKSTKKSEN